MNEELVQINKVLANISGAPFIFLAEDDLDDQEMLIDAINGINADAFVHSTTNGKKAITFLESLPHSSLPSLIVLDYNLPELDGAKILETLSRTEHLKKVPKVVWSTSSSNIYMQLCLDLGAKRYFVKPTELSGIEAVAKEMLDICKISD